MSVHWYEKKPVSPVTLATGFRGTRLLAATLEAYPHLMCARNILEETALFEAVRRHHCQAVEFLVQSGSTDIDTPDYRGWSPLSLAAYNGDYVMVSLLVRLGSNAIDTPNKEGWTPLFTAVTCDRLTIVGLLIRLGSTSINTPNNNGFTPLSFARLYKRNTMEDLLRYLGAIDDEDDDYDEREALRIRFRTHFSDTLLQRCLL